MAIIKCKMCGGDIALNEEKTFGTCEYCGSTMTLPKVSDDQRAARFNRGNHFRRQGEFDKALAVYESIVREDDADAEAHWCCALCRFGIEYVEDPNTFEYLPTCHRASFDSFLEDVDFKAALEHSDGITRRQYQKDAARIAEVQRGILATSQNEEPFDVFICYKETDDETKERTRDSIDAQEIYYQLTQEGYRVFFSRITLEDKAGTEYEPYIFAALNSAKVMIAIGSKPEYFNAVWVKNEWSRFLAMMRKDRSKLLLPCYKGMDPYDLPEQLGVLQSYDMTKIGFAQDLIRGIKKVLAKDNTQSGRETFKETVAVNAGSPNVAPLLKRAFMFLEDGEWEKADDFCEQILNQEPENAQAYLGKLMAELHVKRQEDLPNYEQPFNNSSNYQKAVRFGGEKFAGELSSYIDHINERNENMRLTAVYNSAVSKMLLADSETAFKTVAASFRTISGFKNADELAKQCLESAEKRRYEAKKAAKKRKRAIAIVTSIIVVACIVYVILLTTVIIPKQKMNKALGLLDSCDYEAAYALLDEIGDNDARYERAVALIDSGDYKTAYLLLNGMDYKNGKELQESITPQYIKMLLYEAEIGSYVVFGEYEQDNNTSNGKEDIEWIVLARESDSILVISRYALDCQQYTTSYTSVTWETCSLRKWLNGTFINAAFSAEEQNYIKNSTVTADKNPAYSTLPGNNVTDQVFLLSIKEVNEYFSLNSARQCKGTAYCYAQGANKAKSGECWWWLRSPGSDSISAADVSDDGSVSSIGHSVYNGLGAVRPALWIKLGS